MLKPEMGLSEGGLSKKNSDVRKWRMTSQEEQFTYKKNLLTAIKRMNPSPKVFPIIPPRTSLQLIFLVKNYFSSCLKH